MRNAIIRFLAITLVILGTLIGCKPLKGHTAMMIVNGKKTGIKDFSMMEDHVQLPTQKVMLALGAEYAKSSFNKQQSVCVELNGIKIIIDFGNKVLITEEKMEDLVLLLKNEDRELTQEDRNTYGLLLQNNEGENKYISWHTSELYLDNETLREILEKVGIRIVIQSDVENHIVFIDQIN